VPVSRVQTSRTQKPPLKKRAITMSPRRVFCSRERGTYGLGVWVRRLIRRSALVMNDPSCWTVVNVGAVYRSHSSESTA
jgi:hypothetical protein